jgi:hypothetical protein
MAAVRVFYGAATLPFFANTDENAHFDLVHKLARGNWPTKNEAFHDPETLDVWILDGTDEYLNRPGTLGVESGFRPPVRDWAMNSVRAQYIRQQRTERGRIPNHEAHEPPVYYALAAIWYEVGRAFGLSPASIVYWVRFFNVPLYAALVATSYAFVRPHFGVITGLAVAALTAFFPNAVFFTISNDLLSPLTVLLTLLLLVRWYESDDPGLVLAFGTGLMAASAVLVKLTNAAVLAAVAAAVASSCRRRRLGTSIRVAWPLVTGALLPPMLWCLRNRFVLGDWTGTTAKIQAQTWTPKPLDQLLDHPLFTWAGLCGFLTRLCGSFFEGDVVWHADPVQFGFSETFFVATAASLPVLGVVAILLRRKREPQAAFVAGLSALVVLGYVALLSVLSLRWDFGINPFPSRAFPFFAFGRLAAGAIVPFLLLYVSGIEALFGRRPILVAAAATVAATMMVLMQLALLLEARSSEFNWFHLP